jgi:hypothetical protein
LHYDGNTTTSSSPFCLKTPHAMPPKTPPLKNPTRSVLAWPAWRRVLAVLPAVLLLWLAVGWANGMTWESALW